MEDGFQYEDIIAQQMNSHIIISIKYILSQYFHYCVRRDLSLLLFYTLIGEYVLVTFTQDHLRLLLSFTLASYHVVTTFINISTFSLHRYSPFFYVNVYFTYDNVLVHLMCFTYLTLLGFHHFIVHFIICQCTWTLSVFYTCT